jgi:hypothetical protein
MFRPYKNIFRKVVSIDEQLPEDGLVRPKHVAIKCNFNGKR